jgi:hypothetical protein
VDRARRARAGGDLLIRALPAALLLAACTALTGDFSDVIAIDYTGPPSPRPEEGDTVRLTAVALGLDGQPLPDVVVVWRSLANPDSVGFTLDSLTGLLTAVSPGGAWAVQGRVEDLRTDPPIQVTVLAAPDSIGAVEPSRDTVAVDAPESGPLTAGVFDLTTTPGTAVGLTGKRVVFRLADPVPGTPEAAGVALAVPGQVPGADPHLVERLTGAGGLSAVTAERVGTVQPDSITIEALAFTARGDTVAGSPVRFVVLFLKN